MLIEQHREAGSHHELAQSKVEGMHAAPSDLINSEISHSQQHTLLAAAVYLDLAKHDQMAGTGFCAPDNRLGTLMTATCFVSEILEITASPQIPRDGCVIRLCSSAMVTDKFAVPAHLHCHPLLQFPQKKLKPLNVD